MTAFMLNETAAAIIPANDLPPVLFDDFISFVDRTEKTARTYINNLKQFAAWLAYNAIRRPARQDILSARNQGARCVIVCVYWGRADAVSVTASQKNTARSLAEMGADVILGVRPSRVLPMEKITTIGQDGKNRDTFVAYSLGTLLSESREGYDISGILLHLNITCDEQGQVRVDSAEYTPTYIWRQTVDKKIQYRVVCSADPTPDDMSDQQKEVMSRALNRIQNTLKDSPVSQRR